MTDAFGQFGFPVSGSGGGGGGGNHGCPIDVSRFPGNDLGEKLIAAIAANPSGGVFDCRCLTGAQSINNSVLITVPMEIIFGESVITCTVANALNIRFVSDSVNANGTIIRGSGMGVTVFEAAGSVGTIFHCTAFDVSFRDFKSVQTSNDASYIFLNVEPDSDPANPWVLRPYISNLDIEGFDSTTGVGIRFTKTYVAVVEKCLIGFLESGIKTTADGGFASVNAVHIQNNRFIESKWNLKLDGFADIFLEGNAIENAKEYGVYINTTAGECFCYYSVDNHYENSGNVLGALADVFIAGVNDGFSRQYSFVQDFFPGNGPPTYYGVILGAGAAQTMNFKECLFASVGIKVGAGQPLATEDSCLNFGTDSGNVAYRTANTWTANATQNLTFQTWNRIELSAPTIVNLNATATVTFTVKGQNDPTLVVTDPPNDAIGFGRNPFAGVKAAFLNTTTPATGTSHTIHVNLTLAAAANNSSDNVAGAFIATTDFNNTRTFTNVQGIYVEADHNGTNSCTIVVPAVIVGRNRNTGTVASLRGVDVSLFQDTLGGTVIEAVGVQVNPVVKTAGTLTRFDAIRVLRSTQAATNTSLTITGGSVFINEFQGSVISGERFQILGQSIANLLTADYNANSVAVGNSANTSNGIFEVRSVWTATSGTSISSYHIATANAAGASTSDLTALMGDVYQTAAHDMGVLLGVRGNATWGAPANNVANLFGGQFAVNVVNTGTCSLAAAVHGFFVNAGTIGEAMTLYASVGNNAATFTSHWGLRVDAVGGTVGNRHGIAVQGHVNQFNGVGALFPTATWYVLQSDHTTGSHPSLYVISGTNSGLSVGTEYNQVIFDLSNTMTWATGHLATQRFTIFQPPGIAFIGDSTVDTAATVAIVNEVAAGAHATITVSLAFWVQAGRALFDGGMAVGAEPTGIATKVSFTNTVNNAANSTGVGTILFKGTTNRNSSGFLKILDGTTARYIPYFDAITG